MLWFISYGLQYINSYLLFLSVFCTTLVSPFAKDTKFWLIFLNFRIKFFDLIGAYLQKALAFLTVIVNDLWPTQITTMSMTINEFYAVVSRKQTLVNTSEVYQVFDEYIHVQQVTNLKCELINKFKNTKYLTDVLGACGLYVLAAVWMFTKACSLETSHSPSVLIIAGSFDSVYFICEI